VPATVVEIALWGALGLKCTDNGPLGNLSNALAILENDPSLKGKLAYDEFANRMLGRIDSAEYREWSDTDDTDLTVYIQRKIGIYRMPLQTVAAAAQSMAKKTRLNAPKAWLSALKWDGTDRLNYLMHEGFGVPQDDYAQSVGRCWMVSMVARICRPGCKVDTMPVLEGPQGGLKSSALRLLASDPWFSECHESILTKDFCQHLQGKMMVEISELNAFSRAEVERIKGVISCQIDRYRPPYGRHAGDFPRQCVLAGTTNREDWNRDETGARRFWPVRCTHIDLDWIRNTREQLFAEAHTQFHNGAIWWDVPITRATEEQEQRRDRDAWEHPISRWLESRELITMSDLLEQCLQIELGRQSRTDQLRAASTLRDLGWNRTLIRDGDKITRKWRKGIRVTDIGN